MPRRPAKIQRRRPQRRHLVIDRLLSAEARRAARLRCGEALIPRHYINRKRFSKVTYEIHGPLRHGPVAAVHIAREADDDPCQLLLPIL